jgi:hypothetical protein
MTKIEINKPFAIEIVTPAPAGSLHGNRITALRWQDFLKKLGHQTQVSEKYLGSAVDLLVALHAYRSHLSLVQFRRSYPDKPIVLMKYNSLSSELKDLFESKYPNLTKKLKLK